MTVFVKLISPLIIERRPTMVVERQFGDMVARVETYGG
jgi:hypothetical protein